MSHICICICTYKRSERIQNLLGKIVNQITNDLFTTSVVVVDNDKNESAKEVVEATAKTSNIPIQYFVEPIQSISLARNKAVEKSKGEYLCFIDDDEFPENKWLLSLFQAIQKYNSAGVLGPVIPYYEECPPKWIIKGRFHDRPRHPTGFNLTWKFCRTGNVLLRKNLFKDEELPFRIEFSSGGEDRDFFRRMIEKGYRFVWCDEAPVYEFVPQIRCKRVFLIRRALLRGKTSLGHSRNVSSTFFVSMSAIAIYTLLLPFLLILGHHHFMKKLISYCDHIGRIMAIFGCNPIKEKYIVE